MTNKTDVEKIVEEFSTKFYFPIQQGKCKYDDVYDWLRQTLTTLTTKHAKELEKAVEEEQKKLCRWLEHRPTCYLYTEEGTTDQCDCRLYQALTPTKTDKQ